jgi:hypothetical protein
MILFAALLLIISGVGGWLVARQRCLPVLSDSVYTQSAIL